MDCVGTLRKRGRGQVTVPHCLINSEQFANNSRTIRVQKQENVSPLIPINCPINRSVKETKRQREEETKRGRDKESKSQKVKESKRQRVKETKSQRDGEAEGRRDEETKRGREYLSLEGCTLAKVRQNG